MIKMIVQIHNQYMCKNYSHILAKLMKKGILLVFLGRLFQALLCLYIGLESQICTPPPPPVSGIFTAEESPDHHQRSLHLYNLIWFDFTNNSGSYSMLLKPNMSHSGQRIPQFIGHVGIDLGLIVSKANPVNESYVRFIP